MSRSSIGSAFKSSASRLMSAFLPASITYFALVRSAIDIGKANALRTATALIAGFGFAAFLQFLHIDVKGLTAAASSRFIRV